MVQDEPIPQRPLVAIGGNATHPDDIKGTAEEQKAIAAQTAQALLPLALSDNELIITHGNGPVVGKILMRQILTGDRIGPIFSEKEASRIGRKIGWLMKEDSGRGWRHVVPPPRPRHYCDISLVEQIARGGSVVIAGGGGGIPVVRGPKGVRQSVSAVIDKDLTSALMANVMGIELMMILTATPKVAINFGHPNRNFSIG
jgi:carbamate kinase